MKNTEFMRERLLDSVNASKSLITDTLEELKVSQWSTEFENHMHLRLVMDAFRYGKLGDPNKSQYDRMEAIQMHLEAYRKDGNDEHLIDIANLSVCEFVEGEHPLKHFKSIDDGGHAKKI